MTTEHARQICEPGHGDHWCLIYESAAEQMAVIVPFLQQGLARNECCISIADDPTVEDVAGALATRGVNVSHERERGALLLLTPRDTYLRAGAFDPADMIDFLRQKMSQTLAAGFSGLRITGGTTWALGPENGCERLIEYEALVNRFVSNNPLLAICQYNRSRFPPDGIHQVLRTHPVVRLGEEMCPNPFYEPPEMILGQMSPSEQVDWRIALLKRARAAEQTRQESHVLLSAVVDGITDAVFVKNQQGRYLMINSAGAALVGRTVEEVLGKDDTELFTPDSAGPIMEDDRRIMATGETVTHERDRTAAGVTRTYLVTKGPYRDPDGNIVGIIGIATDITASKRLEVERDLLLSRLRQQIDRLPLGYILFDTQNRVLDWNPAAAKMFGYTREEVLGRDPLDVILPLPVDSQVREIVRRVQAGDMQANIINENRTKDGRFITCEWFNTPLADPDGRFVGAISLVQDITERKRADEELARHALLLANVRDSVIVTDLEGVITHWNEGATRLFGWRAEEMLGHGMMERYPEPERAGVAAEIQAIRDGKDFSGVWKDYHKDGSRIWIDVRVTRITDATGTPIGLIGLAHDITDRKQAEEILRENAKRLQVLSRRVVDVQEAERRHLARELHDEIGQVLSAIGVNLHALKGECDDSAWPRVDECLGIVERAIQQVRNLSLDLRPSMLDDLGLAAASRWLVDRQAQRASLVAHFTARSSGARLPPDLATACYRVLQEALSNVMRHARARQIWVVVHQGEEGVRLDVRDDGVGFDQVEARRRAVRGASLGLFGMRERIELLGGQITVESEPGHGTRLRIWVPVTSAPSSEDTDHEGERE